MIRREFVVQLDGVRLVDGAPERIPASNNRVDVFRAGGSGTKTKTGATPPRGKGWPTRFHFSCLLAGGGPAEDFLAGN